MSSVLPHLCRLLIARLGLLLVSGDKRDAEILAVRHQVMVLQRQIPGQEPTHSPNDSVPPCPRLMSVLQPMSCHPYWTSAGRGSGPRR